MWFIYLILFIVIYLFTLLVGGVSLYFSLRYKYRLNTIGDVLDEMKYNPLYWIPILNTALMIFALPFFIVVFGLFWLFKYFEISKLWNKFINIKLN